MKQALVDYKRPQFTVSQNFILATRGDESKHDGREVWWNYHSLQAWLQRMTVRNQPYVPSTPEPTLYPDFFAILFNSFWWSNQRTAPAEHITDWVIWAMEQRLQVLDTELKETRRELGELEKSRTGIDTLAADFSWQLTTTYSLDDFTKSLEQWLKDTEAVYPLSDSPNDNFERVCRLAIRKLQGFVTEQTTYTGGVDRVFKQTTDSMPPTSDKEPSPKPTDEADCVHQINRGFQTIRLLLDDYTSKTKEAASTTCDYLSDALQILLDYITSAPGLSLPNIDLLAEIRTELQQRADDLVKDFQLIAQQQGEQQDVLDRVSVFYQSYVNTFFRRQTYLHNRIIDLRQSCARINLLVSGSEAQEWGRADFWTGDYVVDYLLDFYKPWSYPSIITDIPIVVLARKFPLTVYFRRMVLGILEDVPTVPYLYDFVYLVPTKLNTIYGHTKWDQDLDDFADIGDDIKMALDHATGGFEHNAPPAQMDVIVRAQYDQLRRQYECNRPAAPDKYFPIIDPTQELKVKKEIDFRLNKYIRSKKYKDSFDAILPLAKHFPEFYSLIRDLTISPMFVYTNTPNASVTESVRRMKLYRPQGIVEQEWTHEAT